MVVLSNKSLSVLTMIKKIYPKLLKRGMQQLYLTRPHVIYVLYVTKMLKCYINVRDTSQETIVRKRVRLNNIGEHKKYCAVVSELESREKHKSEQFTVKDSENLLKNNRNQLVRLLGEKPIIEGYINDKTYKGL